MDYRTLEINVRSAKHLNDVNFISKMDVYAIVFISGDSRAKEKYRTSVDRASGTNPTWNFPVKFSIDESAVSQNRLTLVIILRCDRALGDKDIGEIRVPIKDLLGPAGEVKPQFVTYQVRKPSGRPGGELHFSYKWDQKDLVAITADPFVSSPGGISYPVITTADPYPSGGLYPMVEPYTYQPLYPPLYPPLPPQQGYGYPVRPGYGYYQPVQEPANNRFGIGFGAGLVGGFLIGDMISDAAFCDAGF